jgi:hypothetical protein
VVLTGPGHPVVVSGCLTDEFQDTDPIQHAIFKTIYLTKEVLFSSAIRSRPSTVAVRCFAYPDAPKMWKFETPAPTGAQSV